VIPQSVPSCQALYKNTFTYHNLTESPPDFEECFKFLGASGVRAG
jgi:dual specificity MAP kinase phosphatase